IVALIQTHGESKVLAEPKQAMLALVEARLMIVCVDVCVDGDNRRVPRSSPLARLYCTKSKN
ncbi:MAG: hypothetical protein O2871_02560, partial [bacterium]|nr:hypothetical protein [bacterium]